MELKTVEMHGVAVIEIHGKVVGDVENCHKLHGLFQSLLGEGKRKFVVNLRDVPWMNSLGIGMFIGAYASVKKRGGELVLAGPSERVRDVLAVTQLFTLFDVFDTVDSAVNQLAGNARPPVAGLVREALPRDRPPA
ncbi:MAG TPA: STAS domain-containing protein [Candidatus Krumholzibacteria bacterium]|nr:STAS domain-containing protein [Candidatus Krumholzibacteria bacterium]